MLESGWMDYTSCCCSVVVGMAVSTYKENVEYRAEIANVSKSKSKTKKKPLQRLNSKILKKECKKKKKRKNR